MELPHKVTVINWGSTAPKYERLNILKTIHNAGFFSCATIRLMDIVTYYKKHTYLPDQVDSSEQFLHYKSYPGENLIPYFYAPEKKNGMIWPVSFKYDCMSIQFKPYYSIDWQGVLPFVHRYFSPSDIVTNQLNNYETKYNLDYSNLCGVFFRGNDKAREMKVAGYDVFIDKARDIKENNPDVKFLVQPDEKEFLKAFTKEFPDSIYFEETPCLKKQDSCMFMEVPICQRPDYGAKFFAAVLALSKCKYSITHSGNGALWMALYRGNAKNLYQWHNHTWY